MRGEDACGRHKDARQVDRCGKSAVDALLYHSSNPKEQQYIDEEMRTVEMQERIGRESPVLAIQLTIVGKRSELQQRSFTSYSVSCELDCKPD